MPSLKDIAIQALIAVAAVYLYNTFLAPKIGTPTA
jgi:hypothetical protein